jgi:hypothetical protein
LLLLSGDLVLFPILSKAVVYLGCLAAGLGQVVLQEGDLIVVAETFQEILKTLIIVVMLLGFNLKFMFISGCLPGFIQRVECLIEYFIHDALLSRAKQPNPKHFLRCRCGSH